MFTITYYYWRMDSPMQSRSYSTKEAADHWYNRFKDSTNHFKVSKLY